MTKKSSKKTVNYLLLAVAGLYILSPVDLIPDVIPFLGWVDDFVLAAFVLEEIL